MILVDTSIWVTHFRRGNSHLIELLHDDSVVCHPLIIGELACGLLDNRKEILALLQALPQSQKIDDKEVLHFIEHNRLTGSGVGLVDVHLLASAMLTKVSLWTADKSLRNASARLGVVYR